MVSAALFALSLTCPRAQALEIGFAAGGAPAQETGALKAFASDLRAALPPAAQALLEHPIRIRFMDLDGMAELGEVCPVLSQQDRRHVFGSFEGLSEGAYEIRLHQGFLAEIARGSVSSKAIGCGHKTLYRLALGTAVHEIGHALDASGRFSGSRQYRGLIDWSSGRFGWWGKNTLGLRSPDPYELQSPAESFAVNLEYLLLDPEFACRRPAVARYLAGQLGLPDPRPDCIPYRRIFLSPNGPWVDLDSARVVEIDYLFAAKGNEFMSRWGHALFRLVVCDSERNEAGPACRRDASRHVVVGYRASVLDSQISYWKGLTGGYPSRIYFYNLPDIIQEYAETELRDLISLPLALSQEERELFLDHVLEQHWGYSGRYYFLSNNCATEARDALRSAMDSGHAFQDSSTISPLGLYDELARQGLIDPGRLEPRDEAIQNGYLFPSRREELEVAFAKVKARLDQEETFHHKSLDQFFDHSYAAQRLGYLRPAEPEHAASLYLLEQRIVHRETRKVAKVVFSKESRPEGPQAYAVAFDTFRQLLERLNPWNQVRDGVGYGIPRAAEVGEEAVEQLSRELREAFHHALAALESSMPEAFRSLRAAQENLREFGRALWPKEPEIIDRQEVS